MELLIVGAGRLGVSLAAALRAAGHSPGLTPGRQWRDTLRPRLQSLPSDSIVVLAVPDPALSELAAGIAGMAGVDRSLKVVHLSGSLALGELDAARAAGHEVGSLHPLQSFPVERLPAAFNGSLIAVAASGPGLARALTDLALDLGGRPRLVPDAERILYHAAAVLSGNLLVALADIGAGILVKAGWTPTDALAALLPLMRGVLDNLESVGAEGALIGPIRRGDPAAVRRHLAALSEAGLAEAGDVYRILGLSALRLALEAGLEPGPGELIWEALTEPSAATEGAHDDDRP